MCGRYAASRRPEDMVEEFEVEATTGAGPGGDPAALAPRYNMAPTDRAPVVLERFPRVPEAEAPQDGAPQPEAVRWLRLLTWGLVPSWAKDRSAAARMINARSETLLDKPAYRRAAVSRRCLVPADGWYEWQVSRTATDARGKPRKQPHFIHAVDDAGLAFAGIYEFWRDPDRHPDDPDAWLSTYAVITTAAEPDLQPVHDRMPFVLPPDRWQEWLDPTVEDPHAVRALLTPVPPGRFVATPVTTRVNSVRNDGPELLEPELVPGSPG